MSFTCYRQMTFYQKFYRTNWINTVKYGKQCRAFSYIHVSSSNHVLVNITFHLTARI